jgi:hypothetical protein
MVSVMLSEISVFERCSKLLGAVVMIYSASACDKRGNYKHFCA